MMQSLNMVFGDISKTYMQLSLWKFDIFSLSAQKRAFDRSLFYLQNFVILNWGFRVCLKTWNWIHHLTLNCPKSIVLSGVLFGWWHHTFPSASHSKPWNFLLLRTIVTICFSHFIFTMLLQISYSVFPFQSHCQLIFTTVGAK